MHGGSIDYVDSKIGIEWIVVHGYLDYFQEPLLGGRRDPKQRDHDVPKS